MKYRLIKFISDIEVTESDGNYGFIVGGIVLGLCLYFDLGSLAAIIYSILSVLCVLLLLLGISSLSLLSFFVKQDAIKTIHKLFDLNRID